MSSLPAILVGKFILLCTLAPLVGNKFAAHLGWVRMPRVFFKTLVGFFSFLFLSSSTCSPPSLSLVLSDSKIWVPNLGSGDPRGLGTVVLRMGGGDGGLIHGGSIGLIK